MEGNRDGQFKIAIPLARKKTSGKGIGREEALVGRVRFKAAPAGSGGPSEEEG